MIPLSSPFHPDSMAYPAWRDAKLAAYPARLEDLLVEVADPRALTMSEHGALLARIRKANMALYASRLTEGADKSIPRLLGLQFGLERLDSNLLADEDAITTLTVAGEPGRKGEYIPYTNRPLRWHTDGYYNRAENGICAFLLHCVDTASVGGENGLLDHEIAYILLREEDPAHIRALMGETVMTIPPRMDESGVARAAESGPVFATLPSGQLHMRYTARTRSIEWQDTIEVRAAVTALEAVFNGTSPYIFRGRLEPGMGLVCNNVPHCRSGFNDGPSHKRMLYRARYFDRIAGS